MVRAVLAEFLRDVRDVHVLVLHLHEAEVLLGLHLAARRELRDRSVYATLRQCRPCGLEHGSRRRRLGGLPARVGAHLGVHDEDLDVLAKGENAVKPAMKIIRSTGNENVMRNFLARGKTELQQRHKTTIAERHG